MLITQLNIPDAPCTYAVDNIIKPHLEQLCDFGANNLVFDKVKYGIDFPVKNPGVDVPLTCNIWLDSEAPLMESTPMVIGGTEQLVSLYINFLDRTGGKDNINRRRANLARWILKSFEGDDGATNTPPGLPQYVGMEFKYDSFKIDHTTPFKRINEFIVVEPPWYTTRIDFVIQCDNDILPTAFTPY